MAEPVGDVPLRDPVLPSVGAAGAVEMGEVTELAGAVNVVLMVAEVDDDDTVTVDVRDSVVLELEVVSVAEVVVLVPEDRGVELEDELAECELEVCDVRWEEEEV